MASSQHAPSYTGQPHQPPAFASADELFEAIEDLIEKGLVQPYLDEHNQIRFRALPRFEEIEVAGEGCGTLSTEIAS
jgi:hypothetical protein